MKIAVWSPTPFAGRKSTNLLLMALQAITEGDGEQLIIHADPEGSGPEHFLLSGSYRRRMMSEMEFGVELLASLIRCERFTKEQAINAAYTFAEGKLHVLPAGSSRFYKEGKGDGAEVLSQIMIRASEVFSNVWIELPAGYSEISSRLLAEADCVIVNMAQSPFEAEKIKDIRKLNNAFFLIGAYEQRNILSLHNLELLYSHLRGCCAGIPYCAEFSAACCAGEAEVFWNRGTGQKSMGEPARLLSATEKVYAKWKVRCGGDAGKENGGSQPTGDGDNFAAQRVYKTDDESLYGE